MTEPSGNEQQRATPEQLEELRSLADAAGEDVPAGITASEAEQRITELRSAG